MFSYTAYPYAPISTIFSAFTNLLVVFFGVSSVLMLLEVIADIDLEGIFTVLFLIAILIFSFWLRKICVKAAAIETIKNIKSKARYALKYCGEHPDMYERLLAINPEFAEEMKNNVSYALQYCKAHPEMYEKLAAENFEFRAKYILNDEGKAVKKK
ncbi:MAG: hypothetical protein NC485_01085 [Ruminococcus flavefaciens]|nr:hypothetical protein [Ruminococcus flavefaciens]MCM1060247.1 hypothetical protein [Eubacterium sp.]